MIHFKACTRCRGDLYLGQDMYGRYWECFQCGYQMELHEVARLGRTPPEAKEGARAVAA